MSITSITNATLVTADAENRVVHGATIVIEDDTIAEIRPASAPARSGATHTVDARGGIVMPGLINAHAHLAMTMFRGFADDRDLQGFLDRLFPVEERVLSEETVRLGARLAFAESLRAGCTGALDMFWWPDASLDEARQAGFHLESGPIFIGFPGPDHTMFADRIERTRSTAPHRWLFAHGTYTMQPAELDAVGRLAAELGTRFHIHASENQSEVDDVRSRFGKTPVELLDHYGLLRAGTVLAHAVVLDDHEIQRVAATGTAVAHCPLSNLKLASGVCRVPDLLHAGVVVGLGTDGSASSNDLDLFMAMRTAALLHKGTRHDARVLPAGTVLKMATIDSARALGIDHLVGSIEVGKRADIVRLDPDAPSLTPSYDPISTIVYSASRAEVVDVWVAGQQVVADRQCTTIDVAATLAAMRELQIEIAR
ncbi:MAG: 5-methylthioadenosine/S-adenosylhomocysteine deaminase 2 [Actinomycetota bacterium]